MYSVCVYVYACGSRVAERSLGRKHSGRHNPIPFPRFPNMGRM